MYNWYKLLNTSEFILADIPSRELTLELEDRGVKEIMVTRANYISILYEGIFLSVSIDGNNPFVFEGHAAYIDSQQDLWLGIAV